MNIKLKANLVSGIIFLFISVMIWFLIPMQIKIVETSDINAQTFPKLIALILFIASLILIITEIIKLIRKEQVYEIEFKLREELLVFLLLGILVGYALIMQIVGYLISSIMMSIAMLIFFKVRNWKYYTTVVIACLIISYVFKDLLLVQLP